MLQSGTSVAVFDHSQEHNGSEGVTEGRTRGGSTRTPYTEHNITRDQPVYGGNSPFCPGEMENGKNPAHC